MQTDHVFPWFLGERDAWGHLQQMIEVMCWGTWKSWGDMHGWKAGSV